MSWYYCENRFDLENAPEMSQDHILRTAALQSKSEGLSIASFLYKDSTGKSHCSEYFQLLSFVLHIGCLF